MAVRFIRLSPKKSYVYAYNLILGRASPSIPKKSKLPPRPDDYDDYWYQDELGEWRNEYDDEGSNSFN